MQRILSTILILTMLTATACGNLAVPPPFDEAERGWDIEKGRHVIVKTKAGEEIQGEVEVVDEKGLVVDGQRVERTDIAEMWMKKGNPAGFLGGAIAVFVVVFLALAIRWSHVDILGSDQTPRPKQPLTPIGETTHNQPAFGIGRNVHND